MTPASNERIDHLLENYMLALAGADQCAVSASDDIKNRLAANLERAERAFADGSADGLVDPSPDVEHAAQALAAANERSRIALHGGTPMADLVAHLERGTDHAHRIIDAALKRRD